MEDTDSLLSFSSFSAVKASPTGVIERGGDVESPAGDADRVLLGALTATESVVDATVDNEAFEPVRRSDAASLGRGADVVVVPVGLILAASWLREGGRLAPGGLAGFSLVVAFELIVVGVRRLQRWQCLVAPTPKPINIIRSKGSLARQFACYNLERISTALGLGVQELWGRYSECNTE